MKNSNTRLGEILQIVSANSEDAYDDLADIMRPENASREEMSTMLEAALGYDPISHYDKQTISGIVSDIEADENTPIEVVSYIENNRSDIIDRAYEVFEDGRDTGFLPAAVEEVIEEATGVEIDIEPSIPDEDDSDDDDGEEAAEEYEVDYDEEED